MTDVTPAELYALSLPPFAHWLTIPQVAHYSGTSKDTIGKWVHRGWLPHMRLPSGRVKISELDLRMLQETFGHPGIQGPDVFRCAQCQAGVPADPPIVIVESVHEERRHAIRQQVTSPGS